ncbi:unnamed protein product [Blepharisma stoltei]|uniref:EF-hand domain-containing protein n=1 Tax=Blepharisma stoltei TaxID=1481888 RepID=A0AAU9J7D6_9CILI|nr:unnamed protein product [Blepharisma stoltei]
MSDEEIDYIEEEFEDDSISFSVSASNRDLPPGVELNLPPSRYQTEVKAISERSFEESPSQPTHEEIKKQEDRLAKAQNALNKLKQEEAAKKSQKKVTKKPNPPKIPAKKQTVKKAQQKEKKAEAFTGFQLEKPVKGTESAAPGAAPSTNLNLNSLEKSQSLSSSIQRKQDQINREQAHKESLNAIRPLMNENKAKAQKEIEDMKQLQKNLIKREREYNKPPPAEKREKIAPPPPPVPQPRSLGEKRYKLHQLAENDTTGGKGKLSAGSLSGSMLQALTILSSMISEEFIIKEVQEELKNTEKSQNILASGKDCIRGEIDYHEETRKLCKKYIELLQQQLKLNDLKNEELAKQNELKEKIKILEPTKAVVKVNNGKYVRAGMMPQTGIYDTIEKLEDVNADILKENPLDVVIEKIEKQGASVQDIFEQLDSDNDKVLTLAEIRDGLPRIQVRLTDQDKQLMIQELDKNSDGVISNEEFITILNPKLAVQKEYRAIVGNLDINNPIVFEEEILDMRLKGRMLKKDIPNLVNKLSTKLPSEKKLIQQIKDLEKLLNDLNIKRTPDTSISTQLEEKVKKYSALKEEVWNQVENDLAQQSMQVNELKQQLIDKNIATAHLNSDVETKQAEIAKKSIKKDKLETVEKKLDVENKLIAIIIIQAGVKRFINRIRYRKERLRRAAAARIITRNFKKFVVYRKNKKNDAAIKIQSLFKMNKAIKLKNKLKKEAEEAQEAISSARNRSSTQREENWHNCEQCGRLADRLCKLCRIHFCANCFAGQHQFESHLFYLLSSCSIEQNTSLSASYLSVAELDAIVDIRYHLDYRNIDLFDFLRQWDEENTGEIDYDIFKTILNDRELGFDTTHIANLLLISQRFEELDQCVDYVHLCQLFSS